jgi:bifunctional DNA-binding transcriptional regulator/antitoxin component of YhaV-PrlF toxin-antitoxin module
MPQHIAMTSNGRLVIPANVRSELGMQDGGKVHCSRPKRTDLA